MFVTVPCAVHATATFAEGSVSPVSASRMKPETVTRWARGGRQEQEEQERSREADAHGRPGAAPLRPSGGLVGGVAAVHEFLPVAAARPLRRPAGARFSPATRGVYVLRFIFCSHANVF